MTPLFELLSHEFLRNAVYAGVLASVLCGIIGTFVVVKRLVFLGGGISHAAFGGLGLCHFLGLPPLAGAAAVAVGSALVLGTAGRERARAHDATIGILWAVGMAVGIVFIHETPGYAPNLITYLFGNILMVGPADVLLTFGLVVVLLALVSLFFKEFVALAFDEEFAAVQGVPVRPAMTLLLVLTALALVFLIQLVGIILVMALLTIPPVLSLMVVRSFLPAMVLSTLVGSLMTLGGLALSYVYDLPSGPAIVLLGVAMMGAVALGRHLLRRFRA